MMAWLVMNLAITEQVFDNAKPITPLAYQHNGWSIRCIRVDSMPARYGKHLESG